MKKKDKTPTGKQNKKSQSQSKVHKSGISFDPETMKQLENYAGSEFKGNKSKACMNLKVLQDRRVHHTANLHEDLRPPNLLKLVRFLVY